METKIEAKASEQGADEALKSLYASLGSGVKILLTCMVMKTFPASCACHKHNCALHPQGFFRIVSSLLNS